MSDGLLGLSDSELRELRSALRSGRLTAASPPVAFERITLRASAAGVTNHLQELRTKGWNDGTIADMIDLLLSDRARRSIPDDLMQLVITGPDAASAVRDTAVVVRELFARAEQSVLVAGYAVYQGQHVFRALAARMEELPQLKVRLFLDIRREPGDSADPRNAIRRFMEEFRTRQWPQGKRLPEVFYFPASLDSSSEKRFALHAKCIVTDRKAVFVGSANFTEAAHERNIELGLLIDSTALAERITMHFDSMLAQGFLRAALGG